MNSSIIDMIVVHGSFTKPSMDIGFAEIDKWHKDRGFSMCGYHWIILRNGVLETGRPEHQQGAHAKLVNRHSIGVCLIGGMDEFGNSDCNYTFDQYDTLYKLLHDIKLRHPTVERVVSHRDVDKKGKTCPDFDAEAFVNWETGNV